MYVCDEHGALETGLAAEDREISDRSNAHGDAQEGGVDILASPATVVTRTAMPRKEAWIYSLHLQHASFFFTRTFHR